MLSLTTTLSESPETLARSLALRWKSVCVPTAHCPPILCLSVCVCRCAKGVAGERANFAVQYLSISTHQRRREGLYSNGKQCLVRPGCSSSHQSSIRIRIRWQARPDQIAAGGHDELTPTHTASCLLHVGTNSLDQLFVSRRDRLVAANASLKWLIYWKRKTLLNG